VGGYVLAPGSRHISGDFYHFAAECRPDEEEIAEFPNFLMDALGLQEERKSVMFVDAGAIPEHSDARVKGALLHNKVARFYWEGGLKKWQSPSEGDFALACKLAFYCGNNLEQMYRLFTNSPRKRRKFLAPRQDTNYAKLTLKKAIEKTQQVWRPKRRIRKSRATGFPRGRRLLPTTRAILKVHAELPERTSAEIAEMLELTLKQVRDTLRHHVYSTTNYKRKKVALRDIVWGNIRGHYYTELPREVSFSNLSCHTEDSWNNVTVET
jgi:hypothetical protein